MTIMYLSLLLLLAALTVSTYAKVRGLDYAHGSNPVAGAAILLVTALVLDVIAQLVVGTQGWLLTFRTPTGKPPDWLWKASAGLQAVGLVFLVLGIWRLFASVQLLVPAGRARVPRPPPEALVPASAADDSTD